MEFTPKQLEAIKTHGTNIIVSAGAGSGKTRVLTERTIRNLKKFSIDKMIILTFTKSAAFSMKNKIKAAIKESGDESLKENLKMLETASICTFDSFSLDLVKKYSYLLNIDSDISITDEVVIASIKRKIIDEVFMEFYKDKNFLEFLDTYTVKSDKAVKKDIEGILKELDKIYDPIDYLNNYFNEFDILKEEKIIEEFVSLLDNKYSKIKEKFDELTKYVTNDKEENFANKISNYMNFSKFEDYVLIQDFNISCYSHANEMLKQEFYELKALTDDIKEIAVYKNIDEIREEIKEADKYHLVIIELLKEIILRISEYKKENNYYEFKDITRLAIRLLEENEDIRDYYKENIKEIMIDEYQDTNDLAEYLVSLIANNNVFMVGDVKQSIYRFNNANPSIFIGKYNDYSNNNGGVKIDLNNNFRSRSEVIENINTIFSKIMTESIGGAEYARDHMIIASQEDYKPDSKYNMQILNYNLDDYKDYKEAEIEAFIIANDIKNKFDKHFQVFNQKDKVFENFKYSDATILLSTKGEFELYKKVFDYFEIPLTIHKDEDLTYSAELIVIKNIIKLVGYYKGINLDNLLINTYMSVARSFVLNMSDKEIFKTLVESKDGNLFDYINKSLLNKISYLSEFINNHSISELVKEVLNVFDIYLKIGTIGDKELVTSKIDYLINIALSLEEEGYYLEEFISYLDSATDEEIDFKLVSNKSEDMGVNIMSIHKSKGAEYKICYFSSLNKKFSIKDIKGRFLFSREYGLIFPVVKEGIKKTILKDLYKEKYMKEEISERIRLFYVALTRAKEQMIFVTNLSDKDCHHVDIVPDAIRLKYNNFKGVLESIKYHLKKYIVDLNLITIDRSYEKMKLKNSPINPKDFETIEINVEKKRVDKNKYSHSITELGDESILEVGTNIHECMEYLDFNDFDNSLEKLNLDSFFKNKIKNIKDKPFIIDNAIYHKEYEFIYNGNHGIIDLLVETDDELIVVDYKLSEINKEYYFNQVRGYMEYLKTISSKKISGYLYSILESDYLKVE